MLFLLFLHTRKASDWHGLLDSTPFAYRSGRAHEHKVFRV
jgi:hypothetical protein